MKTRDALRAYLMERAMIKDGTSPEEWYKDRWFRITVGARRIPFWPMIGFRRGLVIHDLHHLLTGYETDLRGEAALAGWELGSGGCGFHLLFWFDRLFVAVFSLLLAPAIFVRAFRRGRRRRNLYRMPPGTVLDLDIEDVRRRVSEI